MTRELHHDVVVRNEPAPPDEGNGVQSIISAFLRNPVAAVEVVGFIGGMYGLYYALNTKVDTVQATSEQHYKDLSSEMVRNNERVLAKIEAISAENNSQSNDLKSLFQRGDVRWTTISDKLNGIEVRFTKAEDKLEYITRVLDRRGVGDPHDLHGEIGPQPHYAGVH